MKRDLLTANHSDIFHEQSNHSFSISIVSSGISPESWKILSQSQNRGSLFFIENVTVLFMAMVVFLLSLAQRTQLMIPVCFEGIGD